MSNLLSTPYPRCAGVDEIFLEGAVAAIDQFTDAVIERVDQELGYAAEACEHAVQFDLACPVCDPEGYQDGLEASASAEEDAWRRWER